MNVLKKMLLAAIVLLFAACEKAFLQTEPDTNPVEIYELFCTDIDENYSGFFDNGVAWNRAYEAKRSRVNAHTSQDSLWQILSDLIETLNDEHVKLFDDENQQLYISGAAKGIEATELFDLNVIAEKYLQNVNALNNYILQGNVLGKQVGYIYIAAFLDDDPEILLPVLNDINASNMDALIIDLRGSVGGYDGLAATYSSFFSDRESWVYSWQVKNGKNYSDFTRLEKRYNKINSQLNFRKPIVLLTDAATASEAEIFTLHMRTYPHVTVIGEPTAGALSTVSSARFLPNGWRYEYSIQRIINADGSTFEGVGIPPLYEVKNDADSLADKTDLVFEYALDFLKTNYNI